MCKALQPDPVLKCDVTVLKYTGTYTYLQTGYRGVSGLNLISLIAD